jgi:hypothetical protein
MSRFRLRVFHRRDAVFRRWQRRQRLMIELFGLVEGGDFCLRESVHRAREFIVSECQVELSECCLERRSAFFRAILAQNLPTSLDALPVLPLEEQRLDDVELQRICFSDRNAWRLHGRSVLRRSMRSSPGARRWKMSLEVPALQVPAFMTARLMILEVNRACARPAYATLVLHSRRGVNAKARRKADAAGRRRNERPLSRGDFITSPCGGKRQVAKPMRRRVGCWSNHKINGQTGRRDSFITGIAGTPPALGLENPDRSCIFVQKSLAFLEELETSLVPCHSLLPGPFDSGGVMPRDSLSLIATVGPYQDCGLVVADCRPTTAALRAVKLSSLPLPLQDQAGRRVGLGGVS